MNGIDDSSFRHEVRGGRAPDVARAALLFAREIAYPDLRPSLYLARLDDWAETAQRRLAPTDSPFTRLECLNDFLFGEMGLRGNREQYADPRNSFLNDVMERGLGLPISLSVIFVEVARRIGLRAEGVGLPGHFIASVQTPEERIFLDPFNGGVIVTEADAAQLAKDATGHAGPFQRQWLAPATPGAILARMLFNLRGVYLQQEDWPHALAIVEHLRILQPDAPEHSRDLGLLHLRTDSLREGAGLLEDYLQRRPDAPDAPAVRQALMTVLDRFARLN